MTTADKLAAIRRRVMSLEEPWCMGQGQYFTADALALVVKDFHTLQAALDASIERNEDTDARLLVAYRALEQVAAKDVHVNVARHEALRAIVRIDRMKAEQEARG